MGERFARVDGRRVRYVDTGGPGRPLVLLHGLGASADRWARAIPHLARGRRVVAPDLLGFGRSDRPVADYTPGFLAGFLGGFLAELGAGAPDVVGSSMGGQVAIEYASGGPEMGRLVLVSPSGIMKHSTPALDAYIMAAMYPGEAAARRAFEAMEGTGRGADAATVAGFVERMRLPNAKLAFMSALLGLKNSGDIAPKLRAISAPTLLVWGSADPVIPVEYARGFASGIPGCRLHVMEGRGHTPYVHDPAAFADIVLGFLGDPR